MAYKTTPIEQVWAAKGNLPDNAIVATADGKYPALDGSLITGLAGGADKAPIDNPTFTGTINTSATGIDFDPSTVGGELSWNNTEKTLDLVTGSDGVTLQLGQEVVLYVRNTTGATLSDGQVVAISGSQGNKPTVALAQADTVENARKTIGVVTQTILNNSDGFVTLIGKVRGLVLDDGTYTEGDVVYLSSTVAGGITVVEPDIGVEVGHVLATSTGGSTSGVLEVQVHNGAAIHELEQVVALNTAKVTYPSADSTKLSGIATGATANSADATLLARANHTGTQAASTISDFDTAVSNNAKLAGYSPLAIITEATTARSLALTDIGAYIRLTNVASCTITLPANATVAWASETEPPTIYFRVAAAGIPTLSNAGVTVNDTLGVVAALEAGSTFALQWVATDVWDII